MITRFDILISKVKVTARGESIEFIKFVYREDISISHLPVLLRQAEAEHGKGTVFLEPAYLASPMDYGVEY